MHRRIELLIAGAACASACGSSASSGVTAWDLLRQQGRTLHIRVWVGSSSCNEYDRIAVDESEHVVRLRAFVEGPSTGDCTADLSARRVEVQLAKELGGRRLLGCRPKKPKASPGGEESGHECATVVPE